MRRRRREDGIIFRIQTNRYNKAGIPKAKAKYINACIHRNDLPVLSTKTKHIAIIKKKTGMNNRILILSFFIEAYIPIENTSNLSTVQEKTPISDNQSYPTWGFIKTPFKKNNVTMHEKVRRGHLLREIYKKGVIAYRINIV